jgi:hypothetical protein
MNRLALPTPAREAVDHADTVFNAGHPGLVEPHVSAPRAAQVAK